MRKFLLLVIVICIASYIFNACKSDNSGKLSTVTNIDEPIALAFNLQPGDSFLYEINTVQKIGQTIVNQVVGITQNTGFTFKYELLKRESDLSTLQVTYKRIKVKQETMGVSMEFDSDKPESASENETFSNFLKLKDFSIIVVLNPKGEVVSLEGLNDHQKIALSDSSVKSMIESSFRFYPDQKVKVGDTWSNNVSTDMASMATMLLSNKFVLTATDGKQAEVTLDSDIKSKKLEGAPLDMELSGKQKGTLKFDISNGMILEGIMTQNINGKTFIQNEEVPMTIESTISMVGKKL